ncbi:MAG TPA: adenylosuccinate lyase [Verrucomicrobiae bacterium]|nr:adenylosuccinate lyase [Verrucomicrobiae bacterium]
MIARYSRPGMQSVWTEENKCRIWLEIEILACEAMARLRKIPASDARAIRRKARFDLAEIARIEERTNHDVLAFLENVASYVGKPGRWIHQGLTSSDLLDTTLAVQMVQSADILLEDIGLLRAAVARQAKAHKLTPMIGRSHGVHAEPITFGLKMALMYDEFGRAEHRLRAAREDVRVGKISGAVGTHAHLDPRVESHVCRALGLRPAALSTQIIQRDRHAHFLAALAVAGCSIERWATEFRHLQRTEVLEVEERFAKGQKGSSAMPHKRNPITGERLAGLARVLRGNALAAMENVALWHERDISHSSVERIILPDSCVLLDYMLAKTTDLVAGLQVYPPAMEANLWKSKGLFFSQAVLLALTEKGIARKAAYEMVQRAAMECWQSAREEAAARPDPATCLPAFLKASPEIRAHLSQKEIDRACSLEPHLRHVASKFRKLGLG